MTPPPTTELEIRREAASDHEAVHRLQERAFGQPAEARLVEALRRRAQPQLSLVAVSEGELVGHIFFSPVALGTSGTGPPAAGLAPVGVEPRVHGRGVGGALIRAGLDAARELGWRAVFLVGDPGYYGRFGFELAAPRGFDYGNPLFDSVLQYLELEPGALDGVSGRVRFHDAFADTGSG